MFCPAKYTFQVDPCQLRKSVNCTCGNPQYKTSTQNLILLTINYIFRKNGVQIARQPKLKNDGFYQNLR